MTSTDQVLATRPDHYLAISHVIKKRIKKYYYQDSTVIYPSIDYHFWSQTKPRPITDRPQQYLVVSRLVPYKHVDLVVKAFTQKDLSRLKLIVVGRGSQLNSLKAFATPNVSFLSDISDHRLRQLYANSRALIHPQIEDFGLTVLESLAAGTPVIAFNEGGATETIIKGKTGLFFDKQSSTAIIKTVNQLSSLSISSQACRQQARRFSQSYFTNHFSRQIQRLWQAHQKNLLK